MRGQKITPGKTLLFFDEIQAAPKAINALRYFYEEMSNLHVVAAGSLLDFALDEIGLPVGRVDLLQMYPMSFIEFCINTEEGNLLAREILHYQRPLTEVVHSNALRFLGIYMAVGGMPEAVQCWRDTQDLITCNTIHNQLINTYRQDFQKYTKKFQLKYVELLFNRIPLYLAQAFKYSNISKDYKKRELAPSLTLLLKAGIIHKVFHSAGNGIPIGAESNLDKFKTIFSRWREIKIN